MSAEGEHAEESLQSRLVDFVDMILAMAALDFSKRLPTRTASAPLDALAVGLNLLSAELEASIVSRWELERVNEALVRSEARLAAVLANSPSVVHCSRPDPPHAITFMAENVRTLLGFETAIFLRELDFWRGRVHPDDLPGLQESWRKVLRDGRADAEYRFQTADGRWLWLLDQLTVRSGPQGEPREIVGCLTDMTQRRQAEEEAARARSEAERSSRAKTDFLARMSHELRTPLNAILGFTGVLVDGRVATEADRREYLGYIRQAGEHLLALVNDLLDLAQVDAGQLTVDLCEHALPSTILEVQALMKPMAVARGVELVIAGDSPQEALVFADAFRLRQVMLNLLSNAIKYVPSGGRVEVSWRQRGTELRVEVADDGSGVPEHHLVNLFKPFQRFVDDREVEGAGIGLSISHRLVQVMGGQMGYEHAPGGGALFYFTLGSASAQGCESLRTAHALPSESPIRPWKQLRVLLVEDNPVNSLLMRAYLRAVGSVLVEEAITGEQALECVQARAFDVILLDMHLPDMLGFEVLVGLRSSSANEQTPVIAISADAMPNDVDAALRAGCSDYLTKPVSQEDLQQCLVRHAPVDEAASGQDEDGAASA